jgi:hypothetical protein
LSANETQVARQLKRRYEARLPSWQTGSASEWIAESHVIATQFAYGGLPGFTCGAGLFEGAQLPSTYIAKAEEIVDQQLAKAGYRLAWMLNRASAN